MPIESHSLLSRVPTRKGCAPRIAGRLTDSDYAAERRVRERASTAAQNDADQGAALADDLIDDVWDKRSSYRFGEALNDDNKRASERSTVVRRQNNKIANLAPPPPVYLFSISEACRCLEISRRKLRKLIDSGDLVATQQTA
jgi:hypothetical protein